ncbi:MAG: alkaline phosphatase family protein, partial [Gemmatimonadota bacterium]|nr:alkaline phosphatase family protein [Gemmatimonadota bacterium]
MHRILASVLLTVCAATIACAQAPAAKPAAAPAIATFPSLVVLVTVDQLRGDYLDRFGSQLNGGLVRLSRGGAWFSNAHHDHAITETAPGHASLLSGRFPRSTGITANRAGVFDNTARVLGSPDQLGASPRQFRGTTLVDWLRAGNPRSRAFSVSMKDRGAILPIGRLAEQVYWYIPDGRFSTSAYYADSLPQWVTRFNNRRIPQGYAGRSWEPLLESSAYREPDSVIFEGAGVDVAFPHTLSADSVVAARQLISTPWIDDVVLAFALEGLEALSIGKGPHTDVMAVSVSATDIIGHRYGPDSKEVHDQILRLDRALGVFLDSLYRLRDSSRVVVVLTGDHGVGRIPELAADSVKPPPERVSMASLVPAIRTMLRAANVDTMAITVDFQVITANRAAFSKGRRTADEVLADVAKLIRATPGVARVDRFADLLKADTTRDAVARRWTHQFPPDAGVELVVTQTPMTLFGTITASHGSP